VKKRKEGARLTDANKNSRNRQGGVEFNVVTRNAVIGSREECCIGEKLAEQP